MDITPYKKIIRPLLGDYRYAHSIHVSEAARDLADRYGADPDKAQLAGILHDIVKDMPHDEQLACMQRYGIVLTPVERQAPKLWHAILGAAYIERTLDIHDQELLDAVRYHTTGRAGMSLLEKIVFTADFIAVGRDYKGVEEFRRLAKKDLAAVMHAELAYTITDLAQQGVAIHPDTVAAYNEVALALQQARKG
jgi:nicotinate-nucleotide adenylyltransferase